MLSVVRSRVTKLRPSARICRDFAIATRSLISTAVADIHASENISSIEVEDALYKHPAVLAVGVVARPDPKWGETPLAFVELRPDRAPADDAGRQALAAELIAHCRSLMAGFKCPREVRFLELPKTSTGKIQKHLLRAQVKSASAIG